MAPVRKLGSTGCPFSNVFLMHELHQEKTFLQRARLCNCETSQQFPAHQEDFLTFLLYCLMPNIRVCCFFYKSERSISEFHLVSIYCCTPMSFQDIHLFLLPCTQCFVSDSWRHRNTRCLPSTVILFSPFMYILKKTVVFVVSMEITFKILNL